MEHVKPFGNVKRVHIVGIKGVAMASFAQSCVDLGITVTGSDVKEDFVTQGLLEKYGMVPRIGFLPEHITKDVELVVYSAANKGNQNPEVLQATALGIRTVNYAQALGDLMKGKRGISVCGVGGKTTTSSMAAWVLEYAGIRPSYTLGVGNVPNLGKTGAYISDSAWYVAESDEYAADPLGDKTPKFLYQHPEVLVCTNLAYDHPDMFASFDAVKDAYRLFFKQITPNGLLVYNGDNEHLRELAKEVTGVRTVSVGEQEGNDVRVSGYAVSNRQAEALVEMDGSRFTLALTLPGVFNVWNAAYAYVAARHAGVGQEKALEALWQFAGTMRRFEDKGSIGGVRYYDDYAHHPDEIRLTLEALRAWEPSGRIVAVFEPHTFSRTKALLPGFVESLALADVVVLLDIFASARESADPSISSDMLVEKLREKGKDVRNAHTVQGAADAVKSIIKQGDVCITLGAGGVYHIHDLLKR